MKDIYKQWALCIKFWQKNLLYIFYMEMIFFQENLFLTVLK